VSIPYPSISLHAIQRLPDPNDTAQEVQGLYMQLELEAEPSEYDDEPETVELTLLPPPPSQAQSDPTSTTQLPSDSVKALFEAVSACSNLHPDPVDQEDDEDMLDSDDRIVFEGNVRHEGISGLPGVSRGASDGGLPPPFPGSGGWITAENVNEFFDTEGNWIGGRGDEGGDGEGEPLGEGAGRVRVRDEVDAEEEGGEAEPKVNGHGEGDGEEHKRLRTE
jgi:chloride channel, nucleotide-sensitive, 1A